MTHNSLSIINGTKDLRYVHKANSLIQLNRYLDKNSKDSLSLIEAKLLAYALSELDFNDDLLQPVSININMFWQMCGIAPSTKKYSKKYFTLIIEAIEKLVNRRTWVLKTDLQTGKKEATMVAWLDGKPKVLGNGTCVIRFDPDLKPALLQLKENYTKYPRNDVMPLQSKYGFALYELLCSMEGLKQPIVFTLQDLAERFDATNYLARPADFNRRVISVAVDDINKTSTSFSVSYSLQKTGKQFSHVAFTISRNVPQLTSRNDKVKDQIGDVSYESDVKARIDYDRLLEEIVKNDQIDKEFARNTLNLIVDIMSEILYYPKSRYRINQTSINAYKIQEHYRELGYREIEFVINSLNETDNRIRSPLSYIRSTLYNAKQTMLMVNITKENEKKKEASKVPCGASGELGKAELEAIQQLLREG